MFIHLVKATFISVICQVFHWLFMIIAPPYCMQCKKFLAQRDVFCAECLRLIKPIVSHELKVTNTLTVKVFAIGPYAEPLKSLILAKSRSNSLASRQLGHLMWQMTYIKNVPFDGIVPIPLHWMRYAKRGYNQAQEIAQVLARESNKPMIHALKRVRYAPFQSSVTADKRVDNVKNVFEVRGYQAMQDQLKGKHLLLVDDLLTSGATIRAAVKELNKLKPASITVIVAARAL